MDLFEKAVPVDEGGTLAKKGLQKPYDAEKRAGGIPT